MSLLDKASLVVTPNAYKASKLYSVIPSSGAGDIDVVRATTASRVNSLGLIESVAVNIPRIDYTNGSCPSLLVEPQRTNIFLTSSNANSWDKIATTITPNAITAPNGIVEASLVTATPATSTSHLFYKNIPFNLAVYTFGCFFKKANTDLVQINMGSQFGNCYANFNLTSGTVLKVIGCTAGVTNFSNGWYYCYIISPTPTILGVQSFIFSLIDTPLAIQNPQFTSAGQSVYAWGAQLEQGSYPTSYIPTVASTVTRNADVITKTGISSLIGQTEGTLFIETNIQDKSLQTNNPVLVYLKGSGGAEARIQFTGGGNVIAVFFNGTTTVASIDVNVGLQNGRHKFAFGYKSNDFIFYLDGVQIGSSVTNAVSGSLMTLGLQYDNALNLGKQSINSTAIFKTRLSNSELAQLTTL
jgi:hypothetical protein